MLPDLDGFAKTTKSHTNTIKSPPDIMGEYQHLTTIPGVFGESILLKLKICSLYHKNQLLQKFNDM